MLGPFGFIRIPEVISKNIKNRIYSEFLSLWKEKAGSDSDRWKGKPSQGFSFPEYAIIYI